MIIRSVTLKAKQGSLIYRHEATNANGLYVDIKDGGVMISSRDNDGGWYMIAYYTSDIISIVTPIYGS